MARGVSRQRLGATNKSHEVCTGLARIEAAIPPTLPFCFKGLFHRHHRFWLDPSLPLQPGWCPALPDAPATLERGIRNERLALAFVVAALLCCAYTVAFFMYPTTIVGILHFGSHRDALASLWFWSLLAANALAIAAILYWTRTRKIKLPTKRKEGKRRGRTPTKPLKKMLLSLVV